NQGILWDFGNIKTLINPLDHQILNNILEKAPTAENMVEYFYNNLKKERPELKFRVRVYENTLSRQSYCEGGDSLNG
ncbi:MAG: 6-carboxytetrahydropterin synthase, partial [Spirochaetales bacterium]|nr:6-carboxytetrahydropterin synthase [Spirochaetales bacterium]